MAIVFLFVFVFVSAGASDHKLALKMLNKWPVAIWTMNFGLFHVHSLYTVPYSL